MAIYQRIKTSSLTPETALKHQIKDYLDLKGVFHIPILQGLGAAKGIPDRFAFTGGKTYGIEVKAKNGRLSEYQQRFKEQLEAAGSIYIEARSVEDVMKYL